MRDNHGGLDYSRSGIIGVIAHSYGQWFYIIVELCCQQGAKQLGADRCTVETALGFGAEFG